MFLRLDDDSHFHSEIDLFQKFEELNVNYAYHDFVWDSPYSSTNANQVLLDGYIKKENLTKHYIPENIINHTHNHPQYSASPSFYNNFEMGKISYFFRPEVQKFSEYVKNSEGIYDYRWGDAIIRFFQILFFTNKIHCFDGGFYYEHQGFILGKNEVKCIEDITVMDTNI